MTRLPIAALLVAATLFTRSADAAGELDAARRLTDEGRHGAALIEVDRHLKGSPEDAAGRFLRARLLVAVGRVDEAVTLYRRLAADLPGHPEPHNNLATLFAARGEVERARRELLAALATHPSYAAAFDNLQTLHARLASIAYRRALGNGEEESRPLKLVDLPAIHDLAPTPPLIAAAIPTPETPARPAADAPTTPAAGPAPNEPAADPAREVLHAVKDWAATWSAKDVRGYLAHYSTEYRPEELSREQWRAQRASRLTKPRSIRVTLKNLSVRVLTADTAQVVFEQGYQADNYRDRVSKRLTLKRTADGWKIIEEKTLSVLS